MNQSRTYYAKKNIIYGLFNKIVLLGLPFISRTIITYVLGSQYLGLNNLFTSILQMLNLAELGFSSAIVFCMYKPLAQEDTKTICALLNFYRKVYRVIGFVIFGIGLCLIPFLQNLINGEIPNGVNIYIIYLIFLVNTVLGYLLYSYKSSLFIASQRNDIINKINTVLVVCQNVLQLILLILTKNFILYLIIMPIFTVLNNLTVAYLTNKKFPQYICKGTLDPYLLTDLKYKISGLMVSKICGTSRNSMDSIIISFYVGLTTVAMYGNYYLIMSGIQGLLAIMTTSISASVGNSIAIETPEKNYKDMMKFVFIYAWISGICTVCLFNLYQPFMKIWMGEEMMFPLSVVISFCIYFYSLTLGDVRSVYMTGAGLWWEGRYRSIAEALTNIVLNILLGKFFGVVGIISATIISLVVINFVYGSSIIFKHYFKRSSKEYYLLNLYCFFIITISCVISYLMCSIISINGIMGLLVKLIICLVISNVIYLIAYHKIKYFKESLQLIKRILKV